MRGYSHKFIEPDFVLYLPKKCNSMLVIIFTSTDEEEMAGVLYKVGHPINTHSNFTARIISEFMLHCCNCSVLNVIVLCVLGHCDTQLRGTGRRRIDISERTGHFSYTIRRS